MTQFLRMLPTPIWGQFRRGGWAPDPVTRKWEITALVTVLTVALFAYLANRLLNAGKRP